MKHSHLIIYHAHCNDGFGAAWVVWTHLKKCGVIEEDITLHAASYGSQVPVVDDTYNVYIVDFSYSPEVMFQLANDCYELTWIDHHETAIKAFDEYIADITPPANFKVYATTIASGTALCFNYYNIGDLVPRIIAHIDDRDMWKFKLRGTTEVNLNLNTHPKDMEHWTNIINSAKLDGYYEQFIAEGAAIKRYYDKTIAGIIATNKVYCYIDGVRGLACNAPGAFASDIGHILATESGTFGLTWEEQNGCIEKCSLRSNGDYDVSAIAQTFGGGGHKNAAGFVIDLTKPDNRRINFLSI